MQGERADVAEERQRVQQIDILEDHAIVMRDLRKIYPAQVKSCAPLSSSMTIQIHGVLIRSPRAHEALGEFDLATDCPIFCVLFSPCLVQCCHVANPA